MEGKTPEEIIAEALAPLTATIEPSTHPSK